MSIPNLSAFAMFLLLLSREWLGMGVAGMIIASDDWDHSRTFPTFSTSKYFLHSPFLSMYYIVN